MDSWTEHEQRIHEHEQWIHEQNKNWLNQKQDYNPLGY